MTRARSLSQLANSSVFTVATNNRVGIGSEAPTAKLDVDGTLNVSGNATIGGVATYEDVTNVDSVGVITARSTIDAKGDISIADKIIHTGDTNTAIRFPAADTVTIETGGTERLRVNSSGHLGIGAANNTSYDTNAMNLLLATSGNTGMTIRSGGSSHFAMIHFADGTSGQAQQRAGRILYQHDGNNMSFHTDNTERFRIDGSGRMGLGTGSPSSLLTLRQTSASHQIFEISRPNSDSASLFIGNDSSNNALFSANNADMIFGKEFAGSFTERMRLDNSGRLLVGTSTSRSIGAGAAYPARLQVESSGFTNTSFTQNSNDIYGPEVNLGKSRGTSAGGTTIVQSGDQLGIIQFAGADGTDLETNAAAIECRVDGTPGSNDMPGRLVFLTTDDSQSNPTERMRIDSAGRLLLNGGTDVRMELGTTGTSGTNDRNHIRGDGSSLKYNTCSGGLHIFEQNGTERMRIDSSGNVLFGKSTTALTTVGTRISSGFISNSASSSSTNLAANAGAAISLANTDSTNGNFSNIGGYNSNGLVVNQINFINKNHSSRTGEITFSTHNGSNLAEAMRIDSSGRLLVGHSTSTLTNAKLQVVGPNSGSYIMMLNTTASDSDGAGYNNLLFRRRQSGGEETTSGMVHSSHDGTADDQKGKITIFTNDGSGVQERMRIDSSGNMGLGTNSPSSSNGGRFIHIHNPGTDTNRPSEIIFTNGVTGTSGAVGGTITYYQDNLYTWNFEAKDLIFGTNSTERMRIDSSGSIFVGHSSATFNIIANTNSAAAMHLSGGGGGSANIDLHGSTHSSDAKTITFDTNSVERMRILSGGQLLVGTNQLGTQRNDAPVQIATGSAGNTINLRTRSSDDGYAYLNFTNNAQSNVAASIHISRGSSTNATTMVFSTASSGVGVPTERVHIDSVGAFKPAQDNAYSMGVSSSRWSAIYAANGTIQTSDQRDKTEIETSVLGTDFIKSLRPVSYKWKVGQNIVSKDKDGETDIITPKAGIRRHWGFIAQEVKQSVDTAGVDFGGWVLNDKDDSDSQQSLRYDQFIAPLTKALQEAIAEIEILKSEVAALKAG